MTSISVNINAKSFGKKFNKMLDSSLFKESANDIINEKVIKSKLDMMEEFNHHKVTIEIENGPNANNSSELLNGYGNLFSFIGFPIEENPIIDLRNFLENSINYNQTIRRENKWYFRIHCPSMSDIEDITPMPWENGNSWIDGIEHGITNLSHYLYTHWQNGRSQEGVQLKHEFSPDASFSTTPYLSKILNNFRENFSKK